MYTKIAIILSVTAFNIPRCFELRCKCKTDFECQVEASNFRKSSTYTISYMISTSLVNTLLPFIILSLLNYKIISVIKQREMFLRTVSTRQTRELNVTRMLVWIVTSFIFCHTLKVFLNVLEVYIVLLIENKEQEKTRDNPVIRLLTSLSSLMVTLHISLNFLVYITKDIKFQTEFKNIINCKKSSSNVENDASALETAL